MTTAPQSRALPSRRAATQCGEKPDFSKIQQPSSSQNINILNLRSLNSCSDERVGKVENRLACMRQAFASEAVAFNSARMLRGRKIFVHPEKCGSCKLWHLSHDNGGPDQP